MMLGSLYLVGSRLYNIHDDFSNYNYILIIDSRHIPSIVAICGDDADIIDYTDISLFPVDINYRIKGVSNDRMHDTYGIPIGVQYDIMVVCKDSAIPASSYVLGNKNLYYMICTTIDSSLREYCMSIIRWAKDHNVYGGAYPNSMGYLMYAMNCMRKGYSIDRAIRMTHRRCLYHHEVYKYNHISHVALKSLRYMANMNVGYRHRYTVSSRHMEDVLRLSRSMIDGTDGLLYMDNHGHIYSDTDITEYIDAWCLWLADMGIDVAYNLTT